MIQGNILYDGSDSDGVVRDGAFRSRAVLTAKIPNVGNRLAAVFVSGSRSDLFDYLEQVRQHDSFVDIWLIAEGPESSEKLRQSLSASSLAELINRFRIRGWVSRTVAEVERAIAIGSRELESRERYLKSRKELGSRNRQLHDLQENLEKIVVERTSYLSDAERELHRRTQATRDLVRFIKELSQTETIEEILQLLAQEVKSFHEVRAPILALVSPEFGARLHFQQSRSGGGKSSVRAMERGWGSKAVTKLWPARSVIRVNDQEDQTYLAQELGRPVARTIAFPLGKDSRSVAGPLLVFEHSFDGAKADRFKNFLLPRMEPLSTALDRVVINRELHAASRLWESTFDGVADPIAVIDLDFRVLRMNQAFARYEELRTEEKSDSRTGRCYEIFAGRKEPCEGCRLREWRPAFASEKSSGIGHVAKSLEPLDWQVRRGHNVYDVNGYPIRFQDDAPVGTFIHHYSDVTKSLELKGHAFQGEKMAAIGLMAGNIAHELNNPLAGLRSLAQVLRHDSRYPESVKNDLHEIEKAAERSSAIIRDLMEFSSAEDKPREFVSLNQVTDSALNMLKTALHDHAVDAQFAADELVRVWIEPHLMQHVIFNIVNNACQAMRESGRIEIETKNEAGRAVLEIRDTGPGIPEEILSRVFEPFFTTKGAGQGTGLGLSMSRWVVESFDGKIQAFNRTEPKGAVFRIELPAGEKAT